MTPATAQKKSPPPDVLASRTGRRLLLSFMLIGLLPLALFSLPAYFQTRAMLRHEARATLTGFARLAKGQLFITLTRARAMLEGLPEYADVRQLPGSPFRHLSTRLTVALAGDTLWRCPYRSPLPTAAPPWPPLNDSQKAFLARGRTTMSAPYRVAAGTTITMFNPRPGGSCLVAEFEPLELWRVAEAGNFGSGDILLVLDAGGRLLASSAEELEPLAQIFPGLPAASQAAAESEVPGLGPVYWVFSDVWLEGALGAERWGIVAARRQENLETLPHALFQSLLLLLLVVFCIMILLSLRVVRRLLAASGQ